MGMSISNTEISRIIGEEGQKFQHRLTKKILGDKVAGIAVKVIKNIDSSLESNGLIDLLSSNFASNVYPSINNVNLKNSVEDGAQGINFAGRIASTVHKYVAQESYFRSNDLKKQLLSKGGMESDNLDRTETIKKIVNAFESNDLSLELFESMNEEVSDLDGEEENSIVESATDSVKSDIDDASTKAEVTRVVIDELKDVTAKYNDQQEALKPSPEETTEHLKFNSTEYVKGLIPVTFERFALEAEKGSYTKREMVDMLLTLEDHGNYNEDVDYVQKRIDTLRVNTVEKIDANIDAVDSLQKIFNAAKTDMDGVFSSFRQLSFGRGDLPAGNTDTDTLNVISKMADLRSTSDELRANDTQILIDVDPTPIVEANDFLNRAIEMFQIRTSIDSAPDYDKCARAIELREDQIGNFMIHGMEQVPAARAERLTQLASGLNKLGQYDGLRQFSPVRLKAIFYKTAQIAKPEDLAAANGKLINFNDEATRVKEMVVKTYKTDAFSEIVDDFFDNKGSSSHLSEENLIEVFAFKSSLEVTAESGNITADAKRNIGTYSKVYASFFRTMENLNIITKDDINTIVREVKSSKK